MRNDRGFALMLALGILASLTFIIMAAADSTQITWGFSHARAADQKLGDAIEQVVRSLPPAQFASSAGDAPSTAPLRTFELAKGEAGAILVYAWPEPVDAFAEARRMLGEKPGDLVVRLEAATVKNQSNRRTGTYLLNSAGNRTAPILLEERRHAGQGK